MSAYVEIHKMNRVNSGNPQHVMVVAILIQAGKSQKVQRLPDIPARAPDTLTDNAEGDDIVQTTNAISIAATKVVVGKKIPSLRA